MTKADAAELVAMLAATFGGDMNERRCAVYESFLADLSFDAAKRAVARLACTLKFLPSIAEIREATMALEHGAPKLGGEAWGEVLAEIRRTGSYGVPTFADPLAAECVRLMDWRQLCLSENDAADRSRFIELYDGIQERERRDLAAGEALRLPKPIANPVHRLKARPSEPASPELMGRVEIEKLASGIGQPPAIDSPVAADTERLEGDDFAKTEQRWLEDAARDGLFGEDMAAKAELGTATLEELRKARRSLRGRANAHVTFDGF